MHEEQQQQQQQARFIELASIVCAIFGQSIRLGRKVESLTCCLPHLASKASCWVLFSCVVLFTGS